MANTYWLKFGSGHPTLTSGLSPTFLIFASGAGVTVAPPGITQPISGWGLYQFEYSPSLSIAFVIDGATTSLASSDRYIAGNIETNDNNNVDILAQGSSILAIDTNITGLGSTLVAQGATIVQTGNLVSGIGSSLSVVSSNVASLSATLIAQGATVVQNGNLILGLGSTLVAQGSTVLAIGGTLTQIGTNQTNIGTTLLAIGATVASAGAFDAFIGTTASSIGDSSTDPTDVMGHLKRIQEVLEGDATFAKSTGVWTVKDRTGATTLSTKTISDTSTTTSKS